MKVLITGGCGFVGTNLALFLKSKNFNVSSYTPSLFRRAEPTEKKEVSAIDA